MLISVVTIFPDILEGAVRFGMLRRAKEKELLRNRILDLRGFAHDERGTVDGRSYGGGEGMVLKPEPIFEAVAECQREGGERGHVILLSPQGRRFDQDKAKELSLKAHLVLICGRYEGIDQRVADHLADEEISVGDFVLSGGEFAALVLMDAVCRLIPGVVGKGQSVLEESFMDGLLDFPHYTRPAEFRGWRVPEVLLSGDHKGVEKWRQEEALRRTARCRPDLLENRSNRQPVGSDKIGRTE